MSDAYFLILFTCIKGNEIRDIVIDDVIIKVSPLCLPIFSLSVQNLLKYPKKQNKNYGCNDMSLLNC